MAGHGIAPGTVLADNSYENLIILGSVAFFALLLFTLRKFFPDLFKLVTGGIFIPPPEVNLERLVAELREKISYIQSHVPDSHSEALENAVTDRLETGNHTVRELLAIHRELLDEDANDSVRLEHDIAVDQEFDTAAKTKRKLVNVFIGINFSLSLVLLSAVYRGSFLAEIPVATQQILLGLYASMSIFIIYVYRSSNARLGVLLAVKEDNKRYFDALRFIGSREQPLQELDVQVIKLLLINRTERERGGEHPYELILKGVSNSNILLKGGKVVSENRSPANKDRES